MADAGKIIGSVKSFSGQKGFGFIAPEEGGHDVFVHQSEIQSDGFRTLREGQMVEFKVDSGEDGRNKAVEVVILARNYSSGGRRRGGFGRGGRRGGRSGDGVECYNCGGIGHLARDCHSNGGGSRGRGGRGTRGAGGGNYRGYGSGRRRSNGGGCYKCGEEGHYARDCPSHQL